VSPEIVDEGGRELAVTVWDSKQLKGSVLTRVDQAFTEATRQTESSRSETKQLFPRRKLGVLETMVDEIGFEPSPPPCERRRKPIGVLNH
jgi:hypothetical protein